MLGNLKIVYAHISITLTLYVTVLWSMVNTNFSIKTNFAACVAECLYESRLQHC